MAKQSARNRFSLTPRALSVAIFLTYSYGTAHAALTHTTSATAVNIGNVEKNDKHKKEHATAGSSFSHKLITNAQNLHSTQSIATVTPHQAKVFGPNASATQALSIEPGVYISGPNVSGVSNRATISMRGVKVGLNGYIGDLEYNGITGLFDGVPLQNTVEGQSFHTAETPIASLLSGINTIYGPGNPRSRWFDSIGGTVNFIPVQPTKTPYGNVQISYGSFASKVVSAAASTGNVDGWSAVLAGAYAHGNSFRTGAYLPSHTKQLFLKVRHKSHRQSFSFGAYYDSNLSYRPNQIPLTPIPGVTLNGQPNGPSYSQQTSGYYSTLPNSVWQKTFQEQTWLLYGRERIHFSRHVQFTDLAWYRNSILNHQGINNFYPPDNTTGEEQTNWYTNTYGDKAVFDIESPLNDIAVGGYIINANTNVIGYQGNPSLGFPIPQNPQNITDHTYTTTYASAFIQDHIKPTHDLTIVPGLDFMDFQTHFFQNAPSMALNDYGPSSYVYTNGGYNSSPTLFNEFRELEPSIGINYRIVRHVALYGSYSTTYQNPTAGNYNAAAGPLTDLGELNPVKSVDYEAGVKFNKKDWMGLDDVFAEINYFDDKLSNETIPVTSPTNPLLTIFSYGTATLQGVNLAVDTTGKHWSTFANLGYLDAYYNSYFSTADNLSYNGAPVSNSPKITTNVGVTYKTRIMNNLLSATLLDQYYGSQYLFNNNDGAPSRSQKLAGYNVINLAVSDALSDWNGIIPGLKNVAVTLNVTNLLNTKYNSTASITGGGYFNTNAGGYVIVNPGAPRALYVTLSANF
jgi:iron complex outermembrane receptor protein